MRARFSLLVMVVTEALSVVNPSVETSSRFGIPTKAIRFNSRNFHLTDQCLVPKINRHTPRPKIQNPSLARRAFVCNAPDADTRYQTYMDIVADVDAILPSFTTHWSKVSSQEK